jgi:hypothetical protein
VLKQELVNNLVKVAADVVVIHDVHQVERVVDIGERLVAWGVFLIDSGPTLPPSESLILPDHEGSEVDNGRLYNLAIWEDTPSDSVHGVVLNVGNDISGCVSCLVADHWVNFKMLNELLNELARNKELKVGFLVDVAVWGTPAKDRVRRLDTVRYGLGINSQNHVGVKGGEHVPNMVRLHKQRPLREGELLNLASYILNKHVSNVGQCLDLLSP